MRSAMWTGFYLLENRGCTLSTALDAVNRLKKAGFTRGELDERHAMSLFQGPDSRKNAMALASLAFFSQMHSPKPLENESLQQKLEDDMVEAASLIGAGNLVTHPYLGSASLDKSIEMLKRYSSKANQRNVKLSLENQIYPFDLEACLDAVPGLYVNIDFAHACARQLNVAFMIRQLGSRLAGLHVSDSDGRMDDYHVMMKKGVIKWPEVMKALADVNYQGDFHLEIVHERSIDPIENDAKAKVAFSICQELLQGACYVS
jgi:sugar phosphate isomerase/epimerase